VNGKEEVPIVNGEWSFVEGINWSSNGRSILITSSNNSGENPQLNPSESSQLWIAELPSGELRRITNDVASYSGSSLSADGAAAISVRSEVSTPLWLSDQTDRSWYQITSSMGVAASPAALAITNNRRILFTTKQQSNLQIWTLTPTARNASNSQLVLTTALTHPSPLTVINNVYVSNTGRGSSLENGCGWQQCETANRWNA